MAERTPHRRSWYFRWWAWTLWALLLVVVAFAIALQPIARYATRRALASVQPVIRNAELKAATDDLGAKVKAWAANLGVDLLSDRVPGRNAVSTVVPIQGDLSNPDLQLWPTIFGVFRNAFVQGIGESFAHLPPRRASEPQNIFEQATTAVDRKAGLPREQPRGRE